MSFLRNSTMILFVLILVVWIVAINFKSEQAWALNPWLPTTVGALLWSVWLETSGRY